MPELAISHRRLKKYPIGDLNKRIVLHTRRLTAPVFGTATFTETYDTGVKLWASVNTLDFAASGNAEFDSVNLSDQPSHKFVIRYRQEVTTENVIHWRDEAYKILKIVNPAERNQYLELYSVLLGDETLESNK